MDDGAKSYIYGPSSAPIAEIVDGSTVVHYLHADLIGSTRVITDHNGGVVGTTRFDEYGNRTGHAGIADSAIGYSGNLTDQVTGLVYLRARDYDPATAQFLSVDPAVDSTHQPYAYVANNPLRLTDPTGFCSVDFMGHCYDGDFWQDYAGNEEGQMIMMFLGNDRSLTNIDYGPGSGLVQHLTTTPIYMDAITEAQVFLGNGDMNVGDKIDASYHSHPDLIVGAQNLVRDVWTYSHWADASDADRVYAAVGSYDLKGTVVDKTAHCAIIEFRGTNDMTLGSLAGILYEVAKIGPSPEQLNEFAESIGRATRVSETFTWREKVTF